MNQEWIFETLTQQGIQRIDAEIYAFLVAKGPNNRKTIAETLNLTKHQLFRSLKNLRNIGFIVDVPKQPTMFTALTLDKVLELLIEAKNEQRKELQDSRDRLLMDWRELTKKNEI